MDGCFKNHSRKSSNKIELIKIMFFGKNFFFFTPLKRAKFKKEIKIIPNNVSETLLKRLAGHHHSMHHKHMIQRC